MIKINENKHKLYTIVCGGIIAFLTIIAMALEAFSGTRSNSELLSGVIYLFNIAIPILLIGELVLLFSKPGERKFKSKWWILAGTIFYILSVRYFSYFLKCITDLSYSNKSTMLYCILYAFYVAGFALLVTSLLESKFWKLSSVGFGLIIVAKIFTFFVHSVSVTEIIITIPIILLLMMSLWKENKIIRTIAIILAVISLFVNYYEALECVAYITLAFLMVPAGKIKFDFYFIPGISFLAMGLSVLTGFRYMYQYVHAIVLLLFIVAPVLLSIAFFFKRFEKLAVIGYILMFASFIVGTFYDAGISAFDNLSLSLTVLTIVKTIALLLFGMILFNRDATQNSTRKIVLIVLSVIMFVSIFDPYGFDSFYYEDLYKISVTQYSINLFFAISMFVSALVLVPFKFTKYQSIGKHIFLSLFTFGVWHLIWVYNVTKNLNIVDKDKKFKYAKELLLYIFIPFYTIYWNYKVAYAIDKYAESNGVESKNGTMVFLLSLVSPLISSILIQSKFNAVEIR